MSAEVEIQPDPVAWDAIVNVADQHLGRRPSTKEVLDLVATLMSVAAAYWKHFVPPPAESSPDFVALARIAYFKTTDASQAQA